MSELTLVIGNKNYSSWSLRAWFLLKEMGLDFNEVQLKLNTDEFEQRIEKYSPSRRVPVLRYGKQFIWDTLSIAEYLNEQFPTHKLWPMENRARTLARSVSAEMHSGFTALRQQMPMNCRAENRKVVMTDLLQADIDRVLSIWQGCCKKYKPQGPWLFGTFSIADAMYAPVAFRFSTYGVHLEKEAKAYLDFLLSRPALQQWKQDALAEKEVIECEEVGIEK